MSKKHKKVWIFLIILSCKRNLNYIDHSLIAISIITGCVSISAFASLVGIPIGIRKSRNELKICLITTAIKMYKSINKKKQKETW